MNDIVFLITFATIAVLWEVSKWLRQRRNDRQRMERLTLLFEESDKAVAEAAEIINRYTDKEQP